MTPFRTMLMAWAAWVLSWLVAALWSSRAASRAGFGREWSFRVTTLAGAALLFAGRPDNVWALPAGMAWAATGVAIGGFLFAWWARIHLGKLWSGSITRKADHRIVDTGPYAIVRHPIYTGLIAAILSTAVLKGSPLAAAGAVVMTLGFWSKARLEERFLREELGAEAYDSYRRRVPMLVPFCPLAH